MSAENKANDIVCAFARYHGFPNFMLGEAGVRLQDGREQYLAPRGNLNCLEPGTRCGTAVLYRKRCLVAGGAL